LEFVNEPDTDFSLPANALWAEELVADWKNRNGDQAIQVPVECAGHTVKEGREVQESSDPSRPGVVVARVQSATREDIESAVACAVEDPSGWRSRTVAERVKVLRRVAQEIRLARGDLMGAAMAEGGKPLPESDPEVSEAIDFVEFYAQSAEKLCAIPGLEATPAGVVAVIPPWNFPIAIPCGGVAAALAAGNTVIMKPSELTPMVAYRLVECFYRGGVPREALQFLVPPDREVASALVEHPGVDIVILTGGTRTAFSMLARRPDLHLFAETGGKNATVVSAMSDREMAVKHVLQSAFGHSGQKCSATSLLILEAEVYDDPAFKRMLVDGAASLAVGSAWDLHTRVNPLIRPPMADLEQALYTLEPGESWALEPRPMEDNPQLVSPGIKWGVKPGSKTHITEFFGPVLAVMRAKNLDHAIELVNATPYGLTSGLQSLDDREQKVWMSRVDAGNLYINRGTTGAIVLRQPFGGMKRSAFGPGIKAGGPNYLVPLLRFRQVSAPVTSGGVRDAALVQFRDRLLQSDMLPESDRTRLVEAIGSMDDQMRLEFGLSHDHVKRVGQDNLRHYLPVQGLRIRVTQEDSVWEISARIAAAKAVRAPVLVSYAPGVHVQTLSTLETLTEDWGGLIEFIEEPDAALAQAIRAGGVKRIRYAARERVPTEIYEAAAAAGMFLATAPVLCEGRIELLWYLQEQSVCVDYHRYGNLGNRAGEARCPVS
jgi:RHH-type proline utilization regulon transcriptional repressor/proline dehydrogenase/delta 1-pyrroline-5-carboxylate dehydrogenase